MLGKLGKALVAAAAVAAFAPAVADARTIRYPKCKGEQQCGLMRNEVFMATVSGTQTTWWTYSDPYPAAPVRKSDGGDCVPLPSSTTGAGRQAIRFASRAPYRFVWRYIIGHHGFGFGSLPVPGANVTVDRTGYVRTHEPAQCGRPDVTREPVYDCGVRKPRWTLAFELDRPNKVKLAPAYGPDVKYRSCPFYPDTSVQANAKLIDAAARVNLALHVRCRTKRITIARKTVSKSEQYETTPGAGARWRAVTELRWTLKLRRVGCGRA